MNRSTSPEAIHLSTAFGANIDALLAAADVALIGFVLDNGTSDTTTNACRRIRATTAGNIAYTAPSGVTHVLAFAAGETQWVQAISIQKTGTTCTGIAVFW